MLIRRFFENSRSFGKDFNVFLSKRNTTQRSVDKRVKRILDDVKKTGDLAVRKYTAQFDKHKINSHDLRISKSRIKSAYKYTDKELVKSLRLSAKRIETIRLSPSLSLDVLSSTLSILNRWSSNN